MAPAIIVGILSLLTAGTGVASQVIAKDQSKSDCEKDCKDTCRANHKALFDGRQKCITKCEAECVIKGNQPPAPVPTDSGINWWYVIGATLALTAILLFFFRNKTAK